jgi:hypothetical protein
MLSQDILGLVYSDFLTAQERARCRNVFKWMKWVQEPWERTEHELSTKCIRLYPKVVRQLSIAVTTVCGFLVDGSNFRTQIGVILPDNNPIKDIWGATAKADYLCVVMGHIEDCIRTGGLHNCNSYTMRVNNSSYVRQYIHIEVGYSGTMLDVTDVIVKDILKLNGDSHLLGPMSSKIIIGEHKKRKLQ